VVRPEEVLLHREENEENLNRESSTRFAVTAMVHDQGKAVEL
jgi:hypothetical protein